ncbi:MAG: sigma-54-dependent Fis family transcriptional regulator [Calditrichaeota bacterium]|nr:MAG: sigma-54-dependent Fis family transcriptional regulator [Calditrichota bacterium]
MDIESKIFYQILNNLPGIIIVATEEKKIIFINNDGEKYFKCKLEKIQNKSCQIIINKEFHETFCLFEEVSENSEVQYKFNVNLAGEAFSVTAFKVATPEGTLIVHNFRFVNEIVSKIRKIENERDKYHLQFDNFTKIFDKLKEAFLLVNSENKVILMNEFAQTTVGISKSQVLNYEFSNFLKLLKIKNDNKLIKSLSKKEELSNYSAFLVGLENEDRKIILNTFKLSNEENSFDYLINIRDLKRIEGDLRLKSEGELIPGFIGKSKAIQQISQMVQMVKNGDTTILIQGESGTGKEVISHGIHEMGERRDKPFVAVNCAAIPEHLIESELFGHEKGAFTGATATKIGKFELASEGTLFLDEIGEMPLQLQTKLLRVLQERSFERVGSNKQIQTNTRVIAATNKNLASEVEKGNFRRDLFFRLNVIPIKLPPLRDRKEDIELLIKTFIPKLSAKYNKRILGVEKKSLQFLLEYPWLGNVRELMNVLEYGIICCQSTELELPDFENILNLKSTKNEPNSEKNEKLTYSDLERNKILKTLEKVNGSLNDAAEILEMHRTTLWRKMKKYGI